jgi:hypothetical protein
MACEEKNRLLSNYQIVVRLYALAVDQLQLSRSDASRQSYEELMEASDRERAKCEFARAALDLHVREHGCGRH